jgi:hypothetical protein
MRRLAALRAETRASLGVLPGDNHYFADPMLDTSDFGTSGRSYRFQGDIGARRQRVASSMDQSTSSRSTSCERRMLLISPAVSPGKPTREQVWRNGSTFQSQRGVIIAPNFASSPPAAIREPLSSSLFQDACSTLLHDDDPAAPFTSLRGTRVPQSGDSLHSYGQRPAKVTELRSASTQTPDISVNEEDFVLNPDSSIPAQRHHEYQHRQEHQQQEQRQPSTRNSSIERHDTFGLSGLDLAESPPPFMKAFQAALDQKLSVVEESLPCASTSVPVPMARVSPTERIAVSGSAHSVHPQRKVPVLLTELRQQAQTSMQHFAAAQQHLPTPKLRTPMKKRLPGSVAAAQSHATRTQSADSNPSFQRRQAVSKHNTFSERLEIQLGMSEDSKRAQENAAARVAVLLSGKKNTSSSVVRRTAMTGAPSVVNTTLRKRVVPSSEPRATEPARRVLEFPPDAPPPHPQPVKSIRTVLHVGPRLDDQLRPVPFVSAKPSPQELARAKAAAEAIRAERYQALHQSEIRHKQRLQERDAQLERQRAERAQEEERLQRIKQQAAAHPIPRISSHLDDSRCSNPSDSSPIFRVQL